MEYFSTDSLAVLLISFILFLTNQFLALTPSESNKDNTVWVPTATKVFLMEILENISKIFHKHLIAKNRTCSSKLGKVLDFKGDTFALAKTKADLPF